MCVALARILGVSAGWLSGDKFIVFSLHQVSTLNHDDGTTHWTPRAPFYFMTWQGVDVERVHSPVRLSFADTVHRGHGQTMDKIIFDVYMQGCLCARVPLYVGLSKVRRRSEDILILTTEDRFCPYELCSKTVNVLYPFLVLNL